MPNGGFAGAPRPAEAGSPYYKVRTLHVGEVYDCTFLVERIFGVQAHWVLDAEKGKQRSRQCRDFMEECGLCGVWPRVWLGYVAVFNHREKTREVLGVGREGAEGLVAATAPFGGLKWVRKVLCVRMSGPKRVLTAEDSPGGPPSRLGPHDVRPTVKRLFNADRLDEAEYDPRELVPLPPEGGEGGAQ